MNVDEGESEKPLARVICEFLSAADISPDGFNAPVPRHVHNAEDTRPLLSVLTWRLPEKNNGPGITRNILIILEPTRRLELLTC